MEVLAVLEKKLTTLVGHVKKLQAEGDMLKKELSTLKKENAALKAESESLSAKLKVSEGKDADQREQTKCMVDSLIKDIDVLLNKEHQL